MTMKKKKSSVSEKLQSITATTVIAVVAALTAVLSLALEFSRDPSKASPPVVNNYLPSIGGSEAQPAPEHIGCSKMAGAQLTGWGPDRPTVAGPTSLGWPALNADRNNPNIGDERNFHGARDVNEPAVWSSSLEVLEGHEYLLRVYLRNSSPDEEHFVSSGTRISVSLPHCVGRTVATSATIRSETAFPSSIWDGVNLTSNRPFRLNYIPNSALIENNAHPDGGYPILGDDFLSPEGMLVGYEEMNGAVRGGFQHDLYFSFRVTPNFA